jgi:hypothetical protein
MVCNFKLAERIDNADKAREDFDSEVSKTIDSIQKKFGKEYNIDNAITINSALNEILRDFDVSLACSGNKHNYSERIHIFDEAIKRLDLEKKRYLQVKDVLSEEYLHN